MDQWTSSSKWRMDRRRFGALAVLGVAGTLSEKAGGETEMNDGLKTEVALAGVPRDAPEERVSAAVREAAEAATDFSWLSRGDKVYLKPASNSGKPYPATTSPAAIKAMIQLLKEKGAGRVIFSDMAGIEWVKLSPSGLRGRTRKLMAQSGMARAAVEGGAELYYPEEEGWGAFFEDGPVLGSHWKAGIMVPRLLKEVDHVVLLPRVSRHALAGATLGLKAVIGYMRTDSRLEYHRDAASFHEKTAEANTIPLLKNKLRLVLSVATRLQTTFGPDQGYVVTPETGLVFASTSLVGHDMVSLAWLLLGREQTPPSQKKGMLKDPYQSPAAVALANRAVVYLLGGAAEMLRAQPLKRHDINTIWDDKVLNHAYQVLGGRPRLVLHNLNDSVPSEIADRLQRMTTPPGLS